VGRLASDIRFALRALAQRPAFAAAALATLAIGIGANAAVFSVAQAVLLRPLPFRDPDGLVMVWERNVSRNRLRNVVNPGNYLAWRERNAVFADVAAFASGSRNVTGDGPPVRLDVGAVTPNFFATLGIAPRLGRAFADDDGRPGAPAVAILSDGLWRDRFAADPAAVGRRLVLDGEPATVVGVMPAGFALPAGAELWVPLTIGEGGLLPTARGRFLLAVARLRDGVTAGQAQAAMDGIARRLVAERPDFNTGWDAYVAPLHADLVRDVRPAVLVLAGAVGLVLLVGCGNIATLLLARSLGREREIAIRSALGAGTGRLVSQLLTESLVLALAGGALGLLLASWLTGALTALVPAQVQALVHPALDARVAAVALALAAASAVLFGLAPAWHTVRPDLVRSLREGGAGTGLSGSWRRLARGVVAGEVALALVLLVGASVLLRSFARLSSVDAGFDPGDVLSLQVSLAGPRYSADGAPARFYADALARVSALPGVESASAISWRPFGIGSATRFAVPDRPAPPLGQEPTGEVRIVTPGLFRTLGITLREGRDFDARDAAGAPQAVIVNETVARAFWPGQSALGRRISMQWGAPLDAEIVGVVADARLVSLDTPARATLYWPVAQVPNEFMTLLVRSSRGPGAVAGPVREAIASLDAELPVAKVAPLRDVMADSIARPRVVFLVIGAFAGTAVLLATFGLFGVLSYSVGQRLPEIGVRMALGARPRDVTRLVLREAGAIAGVGGAIGLAGALALAHVLERLLFETSARDPLAMASVVALVALATLAAAWLPARRASRVDPVRALRSE
jgi:putative ABC transport system permease protein